MSYLPDVDIGANHSTIDNYPSEQGGTVVQRQDPGDLDAVVEMQGPVVQKNPFQEVMLFIGEFARVFSTAAHPIAPMAALVRIQDICQAIRSQQYNA